MTREIQLACFDVDHVSHPETKRASKLDHVCIASIGNVKSLHATFLADICSFNNPQTQFLVARIQYGGRDDPASGIIQTLKENVRRLGIDEAKVKRTLCLEIANKLALAEMLSKTWNCYGGSWVIAADCSNKLTFLDACHKAGDRKLPIPEVRDILVSCSRLAAASFDDSIFDLVTQQYTATQMREFILKLVDVHHCIVQLLPGHIGAAPNFTDMQKL